MSRRSSGFVSALAILALLAAPLACAGAGGREADDGGAGGPDDAGGAADDDGGGPLDASLPSVADAALSDAGAADAPVGTPSMDAAVVDASAPPPPPPPPPPIDAAPPPPDAGIIVGGVCEQAAQRPDNDGCAAAINLTAAASLPGGVITYGDTTGYANNVPEPPTSCTGGFNEDGADAIYKLTATVGKTITATVTPEGWDASLYLVRAECTLSQPCLAGADAHGTGGAETLSFTVTTNGTYFLYVDSFNPASQGTNFYGCYTLTARIE